MLVPLAKIVCPSVSSIFIALYLYTRTHSQQEENKVLSAYYHELIEPHCVCAEQKRKILKKKKKTDT